MAKSFLKPFQQIPVTADRSNEYRVRQVVTVGQRHGSTNTVVCSVEISFDAPWLVYSHPELESQEILQGIRSPQATRSGQ
jgi:hypothetical protein